jgi:hypothetical protein
MKKILLFAILISLSCTDSKKTSVDKNFNRSNEQLVEMLDSIWILEQEPLTLRDSMMELYGVESFRYIWLASKRSNW